MTSISKENTIFTKLDRELHDKVGSCGFYKFGANDWFFILREMLLRIKFWVSRKLTKILQKKSQTLPKSEFAFENGKVKKTMSFGLNLEELKPYKIKLLSFRVKF